MGRHALAGHTTRLTWVLTHVWEACMDGGDVKDVVAAVRRLVRERVVPLYGFAIPEEYGGLGLSMAQEARLVMELGYTTPAFRSLFGTNDGIAGHVLSGIKRYITNAPIADLLMVFARHGEQAAATRDISVFLVPKDAPGLSVGPKDKKMGQHGAWTAEVFLDDVPVPDEALVRGQDGHGTGYLTAMRCLAHGRLHIAPLCAGMAQRLLEETVSYALARTQSGQPIAADFDAGPTPGWGRPAPSTCSASTKAPARSSRS
jgi:acyl-CoA dehydrogenase